MKSVTVIYHRADFDGLFCREIAKKFLGEAADYIGWDYGDPDPLPDGETPRTIYMLDISVPSLMDHSGLIWIDHHKSAMEKFNPAIRGCRIDGVAACRLAWQLFRKHSHDNHTLPTKDDFVSRIVSEPLAVRLAGEYDIWDKRDPRAELFQHVLRSRDLANDWALMLSPGKPPTAEERAAFEGIGLEIGVEPDGTTVPGVVAGLLAGGRVLQYAREQEYAEVIKDQGFTIDFEGLRFLACNSHECDIRSHLFAAGIRPEHDALLGFTFTGKDWRVSLYGVPGKPDIDLSKIASAYGGGGHKQACGFRAQTLPFLP